MDFPDLIQRRFSARSYLPKEVEKEKLEQVLNAARLAPSAGNLQSYKIVLVTDRQQKEDLAAAALGQSFISEAPVALVFLADLRVSGRKYGERGARLYSIQDATIAAAYAQLAAADLGLGTVWVGAFDSNEVMRIAKAGEYEVPVAILPIGYTNEKPEKKPRKRLEELVR